MKKENEDNCLYRMFGDDDCLLYVGATTNIMVRIQSHHKHKEWFKSVTKIELQRFDTKEQLLAAETAAIKNEKPIYNIFHNGVFIDRDFVKDRKKKQRALFVERFSAYVESTGKTWFQCAFELGICHTAISRWKNGRICPNKSMLLNIEKWSSGSIRADDFDIKKFNEAD